MQLDRLAAAEVLQHLAPDLVVDASGPFQVYGDDPYALARQVIEAGADYIDLADGADFVSGITAPPFAGMVLNVIRAIASYRCRRCQDRS